MDIEKTNKNSPSQFLKTDSGKTKSNAIEVPSITLPKGGGAIKGIDEKFTVNVVNGTASFSMPLPFSNARGASPALNLSYNSGAGNSVFGLGWALNLQAIKRKTDNGLPQYIDEIDSDTFIFDEAGDLVPEFKKIPEDPEGRFELDDNGNYILREKDSPDNNFTIRFYRPRIEGMFGRIERWSSKKSREIKWKVTTKDNLTTLFGWSETSRISDPKDPNRIFEWLPEFVFDDKGNCSQYIYRKEDKTGFDDSLLCNQNRIENGEITYTNNYLEKVLYGNKAPYDQRFKGPFPLETDYMFQTVFDYGDYETNAPYAKKTDWNLRKDSFSDYKAGFEIRTTRLCKRILLFHYFNELKPGGSALIKSLDLEYDTYAQEGFTFLKSITTFGYIKKEDETYTCKSLPPIEFEYQKHERNSDVKTISTEDLVHAPSGLDEQQYHLIDLFNEGLPGILTEQANGWFYKHNLGGWKDEEQNKVSSDGKEYYFEQAKLISPKPSFTGLGGQLQLMDLDSDGGKQLVNYSIEPKGYFELNEEDEWQAFRTFEHLPNINMQDANTRMLDLNGDGKPEALITEDNVFTWYESVGKKGFDSVHKTLKPFDEERGPHIIFADIKQTLFLADMSGDGMTDIVRIRNGEVCYWPNIGYGRFGAKISMDNAPVFDYPDSFNPAYLRLADIDGSGTTDIIYLGKNKFTYWMNLSGNSFHTVTFEIGSFPEIHSQAKISVVDLLGRGVSCIVWSSPLSKDIHSPLKYIDLMNGKKPHIMVSYKNNFGKEVYFEYTPSTKFYIEDKKAGKPWVTKLHFPVQCISKIETRDVISGFRFVSSYKYHHGYYDHIEKEFRGFGMVEQTDTEYFDHCVKGDSSNIECRELHQEPVITKNWFHTGAFLGRERILNQFAHEYWYEEMKRQGFDAKNYEQLLPDARLVGASGISESILEHLSAEEWREALRACKGIGLRSEVFAEDAPLSGATLEERKRQLTPYTASSHNCVIELLQPKGINKHAVFVVKESEAITYSYERNTEDPRIAHSLNIKLDEHGNILEAASVVYSRLLPDTSLPDETVKAQNRTIIYTQNIFTDDVIGDDDYRLRMLSEAMTFELKDGTKKDLTEKGEVNYYSVAEFENIIEDSTEVSYHEIDKEPEVWASQKRLIEHTRTTFYNGDLTGPLPLGKLNSRGLAYESYQLAYKPDLLADIFGEKVNTVQIAVLMGEGKFTHLKDDNGEDDDNWWVRSGTMQYIEKEKGETAEKARDRFYVPISYTDPYDAKTKVTYDKDNYFLFIKETEDALENKTSIELFNYRTLSPQRMKDMNNNISEAITDELGFVKAMALLGKGDEADDLGDQADPSWWISEFTTDEEKDLLDEFFDDPASEQLVSIGKDLLKHATGRFVYDFDAYINSGKPAAVASILREEHCIKNVASPVQICFEYSNGLGHLVMKKTQAEPGVAKKATIKPDDTYTINEVDTSTLVQKQLRWIGTGRTVLNNKGNVVKQYEPYFSVTQQYEDLKELVETGVTPILYYDALGRLIKTDFSDGTFSKTEFDSWKQDIYDQNDTILESTWYQNRINHLIDKELNDSWKDPQKEKCAAEKAAKHANTPNTQHFDTLGRPVLSIERNVDPFSNLKENYHTKTYHDVEGNLRSVTDARNNLVMQYKYDMLGNKVYQSGMDAGQRWMMFNVMGNPLRSWDERNNEFLYVYDDLHRPTISMVTGGYCDSSLDHIFDRIVYGETELNPELKNLRGQIVRHYDTGGLVETPDYDFKGQPKFSTRRLFRYYKAISNWISDNLLTTDLETESFTTTYETDALGRVTRQTMPDGSIIIPIYNEAGLLERETVTHKYVTPTITTTYIKSIDYNEKGQRCKTIYGNDVITKYYYDKETFRLNRLESKRSNGEPLQDWYYTYDPVGNITFIEDDVNPIEFFKNQIIAGISEYTYDALYRLKEASGRENSAAIFFGDCDNWNDAPFMHQLKLKESMGVWNYTEKYKYDDVGNILEMYHQAADNSWTRNYDYEEKNNRLKGTMVGRQVKTQPKESDAYTYMHHDKHGFMIKIPHLEEMAWNFKEELIKTVRQKLTNGGTPETTYYQYDWQGQRIRKITENKADAGICPTPKNERIYMGEYELYKKYSSSGEVFECASLSLMDQQQRFAMIEIRKNAENGTEKHLVRYQLHDHLGSAKLELDGTCEAKVISYEEYHPYGTTAYLANNADIKSAVKRYRYTGKERDEESGLYYYGARYYMPWIGRWLCADPLGIKDSVNVYSFVLSNPIKQIDKTGLQTEGARVLSLGLNTTPKKYVLPGSTSTEPINMTEANRVRAEELTGLRGVQTVGEMPGWEAVKAEYGPKKGSAIMVRRAMAGEFGISEIYMNARGLGRFDPTCTGSELTEIIRGLRTGKNLSQVDFIFEHEGGVSVIRKGSSIVEGSMLPSRLAQHLPPNFRPPKVPLVKPTSSRPPEGLPLKEPFLRFGPKPTTVELDPKPSLVGVLIIVIVISAWEIYMQAVKEDPILAIPPAAAGRGLPVHFFSARGGYGSMLENPFTWQRKHR